MSGVKLKLTCLVWPDDSPDEHTVEVKINNDDTVATLKELIRDKHAPRLDKVDARDLVLWKCSGLPDDNLEQSLKTLQFDGSDVRLVRLHIARRQISQLFEGEDLSKEPLHVLVEAPALAQPTSKDQTRSEDKEEDEKHEAHDKITELIAITHKKYKSSLAKNVNAPSPSASAKSGGYVTFQKDGDPIYDGRYVATLPAETRAPPIQIYHPDFAHFWDDSTNTNLEVPPEVVRATARFMGKASGIYKNEDIRRFAIRSKLLDVLNCGMKKVVNLDSTSRNGIVITQALVMVEAAAIGIEEDKNEFGDGGSNPSTQAGLSYGRFWAQSNHAKIRENSCCPSFLIAIAGASIAILGAIWTDKIIVQRLTDYIWLGHDTIFNDEAIYRNARILYALSRSLRRLDTFYKSLKIQPQPPVPEKLEPRYFPSINAYRGLDDTIINFTFIIPLELDSVCTTFLAKTEGPVSEPIVVKFVRRYNKEAHQLLAAKGMAPKLRYCDKVGVRDGDPSYGHLRMIVMDFVDGETVEKAQTLPPTFHQQIQDILTVLHQADYVFGDLRGPNVMITKNNEVVFIDFDMVGKHGESTYPIMMSPSIQWADGVADGLRVMMKEHDLEMLQRLVPGASF
ncbi:unnamed protein product [Cyclocybe aegerita]|uniref:non-specific serine/threonine protein kinase n=1 Tax=Cyclocybe aegerita TaxID=1973307 RepID=A0A8S0WI62_CYCAE|nr:unnamed protein product [Cyclocybe aegerita]